MENLGSSLPGIFEDCQFEGIKFTDLKLTGSRFLDCKFKHSNFSGVKISGASLRNSTFEDCNLMGVNWTTLSAFENCSFNLCKLDYAIFTALKLKKLQLIDCSVKEADFSKAFLAEADFAGSILTRSTFTGADLSKADFRSAKEYAFDPTSVKIKGTRFGFPEAISLLEALGAVVEI